MPLPADLTVAELKLRLDKQLDVDDALLDDLLNAAFTQAEAPAPWGTGRVLTPNPAPQGDPDTSTPVQLDPIAVHTRYVRVPDARELTAVSITDTLGTVTLTVDTDYDLVLKDGLIVAIELDPTNQRWRCRDRRRKATLTGRWGFATLPADLTEAIYVLAGRMFYERDAQYADQVVDIEGGGAQTYFRQLPPRTKITFARYAPLPLRLV